MSYSVCAKVSPASYIRENKGRHREDTEAAVQHKGSGIYEAEVCPDHIHMMVSIPPSLIVAQHMGYLPAKNNKVVYHA